jgi:hypothetical protein
MNASWASLWRTGPAGRRRPTLRDATRHTLLALTLAGALCAGAVAPAAAATASGQATGAPTKHEPSPDSASTQTTNSETEPRVAALNTMTLNTATRSAAAPSAAIPAAAAPNTTTPTLSLKASNLDPWPTQATQLTAVSSVDVGANHDYLDILDVNTNTQVGQCSSGTTCTASATENTGEEQQFIAYITDAPGIAGGHDLAFSGTVEVTWLTVTLALSVTNNQNTIPSGNETWLTVTSNMAVYSSPFAITIWDVTPGIYLNYFIGCYATCSVLLPPMYGMHDYVATLSSGLSDFYPPSGVQVTSAVQHVLGNGFGMNITLSAPASTAAPETVTAVANVDVGPTPYYIEIFDQTGKRLAMCGAGTNCSIFGYDPAGPPGNQLTAYICVDRGTGSPPAVDDIAAVSNTITTVWQ